MFVSIVIPTYNKYQRLHMTLLSLTLQTYPHEKFEIVIVSDGSTDATEETVKNFQKNYTEINVRYIHQANGGRSSARNTGIKNAKGELIIFLDDDRMAVPEYVEEHVKSHVEAQKREVAVLGKRMNLYMSNFEKKFEQIKATYIEEPNSLYKVSREEYYWRKVKKTVDTNIAWIMFATGNVSIRRDVLIEAGGFNEQFVGWGLEDTELGYRLFLNSVKFIVNENAMNYHIEHARKQDERQEEEAKNHELFYSLHPDLPVLMFRKFVHGDVSLEEFKESVCGKVEGDTKEETFYNAGKAFLGRAKN